jgi:hypothetical protein
MTLYFVEPVDIHGNFCCPGHKILLGRLGWPENVDIYIRWFVRIEVLSWDMNRFRWDEGDTLPPWIGIWEDEIKDRCAKLNERVKTMTQKYLKDKSGLDTDGRKKLFKEYMDNLRKIPGFVPPEYKHP